MQRNELVNWANVMGFDPTTIPNDAKLEAHLKYLQNNASTMAGTLATGVLTLSGDLTAGDQVLIGTAAQGGKTYTFVTALTGVKATGVLTSDGTAFADGETVSVQGVTYTFKDTLSSPAQANEVLNDADEAVALDNLKLAINKGATEGTNYSTGTVAHPYVTATTNTATEQTVEAKNFGTYANEFSTTETCAHAAWGASKMSGGVENVLNEVLLGANAAASLDNLKLAINNSATEGTQYSAGTKAHPLVTATTNTDTEQTVQARDMAVGEDISTTDPVDAGTDIAWGATTLASGVADQNAVNAAAVAQTGLGKNANV